MAGKQKADWRSQYPFESNLIELEESVRMHYVDESPTTLNHPSKSESTSASPGETFLCVHGNPTWSFYYRSLIKRFRGQHRVVAVDHIGCGISDKPQKYDYTLAQHRDNLVRLIDHLNLANVTLVAHDWGGAIGLASVLERSDRFKRIVLLNTGAFPPPYVPYRIAACRIPLLGTFAMRQLNAFARAAITMAVDKRPLDTDAALGLLAPYDNWRNRVAINGFVQDIPMSPRHPTHSVLRDIESRLPTLAPMPVHLVWGMKDWCFRPECLERFEKIWPHATATRLDDCGHYVIEDDPESVLDSIQDVIA
ncbi:MAG: alpha/beta fold hydrolase [Planctomycetota bacterium]